MRSICVRGAPSWDDMDEDSRPNLYSSWYLPLIDAGKSMPDASEQMLRPEAAMQGTTTSNPGGKLPAETAL